VKILGDFFDFAEMPLQDFRDGVGDGLDEPAFGKTGSAPPMPPSCTTTSFGSTPLLRAREISRPMASASAMVE